MSVHIQPGNRVVIPAAVRRSLSLLTGDAMTDFGRIEDALERLSLEDALQAARAPQRPKRDGDIVWQGEKRLDEILLVHQTNRIAVTSAMTPDGRHIEIRRIWTGWPPGGGGDPRFTPTPDAPEPVRDHSDNVISEAIDDIAAISIAQRIQGTINKNKNLFEWSVMQKKFHNNYYFNSICDRVLHIENSRYDRIPFLDCSEYVGFVSDQIRIIRSEFEVRFVPNIVQGNERLKINSCIDLNIFVLIQKFDLEVGDVETDTYWRQFRAWLKANSVRPTLLCWRA